MSNAASENDLHNTSLKSSNTLNTSNNSNVEHVAMLADIMKAITTCNSSVNILSCNLEGTREDLTIIRQDMHTFKERISAAEERISTLEDSLHPVMKSNKKITQQLSIHDSRLEDIENLLCRNNVRIVGLPERAEGNIPVKFIEKWLISTLGAEHFTSLFFLVEWAHRVPVRSLPSGGAPRTFIQKMLNYKDRDIILQRARHLPEIWMDGSKIRFFPDFSAAVQRQRAGFMEVKRQLRQMELSYSILFPARLLLN